MLYFYFDADGGQYILYLLWLSNFSQSDILWLDRSCFFADDTSTGYPMYL